MKSIIRVAAAVSRVVNGDIDACVAEAYAIAQRAETLSCEILCLPSLALCGASWGDFSSHKTVQREAEHALHKFASLTRELQCCFVFTTPDRSHPHGVPVAVHRGRVFQGAPAARDAFVFRCGELLFTSCAGPLTIDAVPFMRTIDCDLFIFPSAVPVVAGDIDEMRELATVVSRSCARAVTVCNIGVGESSAPHLYAGYCGTFECGRELDFRRALHHPAISVCDVDVDIVRHSRGGCFAGDRDVVCQFGERDDKRGLFREIDTCPYLPEDKQARDARLGELFDFQVKALYDRLRNTGITRVVLGVSGGIDSTLALLVAAEALRQLSLPASHLVGVTMPGLGTTDRTYYNALGLISALGATSHDISIKAAINQHFEDIGHNPAVRDVVYENAQARERTQILLSLANEVGAIVLGTGDLSEAALGWSTFGGDHFAHYNINIDLPKTVIRLMIEALIARHLFSDAEDLLRDVIDTPYSPELLPPHESGETAQKTEELIGPYELSDFFLYYTVRHGLPLVKLYYYACVAFVSVYDREYIKDQLIQFVDRFVGAQFKRATAPESARIAPVSLSGTAFTFASDMSRATLLRELEEFKA